MNQKCTLLVNTCDEYSDVWDLFFKALKIQWADCNMPIIMNTEKKAYQNDEDIKVVNYENPRKKDCWGRRYKEALRQIDTPYVFPVLEDYVLKEPFRDNETIEKVINWMDDNPEIGVFYFYRHSGALQEPTEFEGFGLLPQKCEYKLSTGFALWRKEYLEKCIKGIESPWEWELYATRRAWRFTEKEYALLQNQKEKFVVPYGGVIRRGLWHIEAPELAKKYGVNIDFQKRGIMDINNPYREEPWYYIREHFPQDIFTREFWKQSYARLRLKIRIAKCER